MTTAGDRKYPRTRRRRNGNYNNSIIEEHRNLCRIVVDGVVWNQNECWAFLLDDYLTAHFLLCLFRFDLMDAVDIVLEQRGLHLE